MYRTVSLLRRQQLYKVVFQPSYSSKDLSTRMFLVQYCLSFKGRSFFVAGFFPVEPKYCTRKLICSSTARIRLVGFLFPNVNDCMVRSEQCARKSGQNVCLLTPLPSLHPSELQPNLSSQFQPKPPLQIPLTSACLQNLFENLRCSEVQ